MYKYLTLFFLVAPIFVYSQTGKNIKKIDLPESVQSLIGFYDIYKNQLLSDSILVNEQNVDSIGKFVISPIYKPRLEPTFDGFLEWLKDISTYYDYGNKRYYWSK